MVGKIVYRQDAKNAKKNRIKAKTPVA